ncbi:MAG: class I SAM-dependent methyltransferase [Nitrososphaeraceae archaeon]
MSTKVKSYFETHAHNYPKSQAFYLSIVEEIKKAIPTKSRIKLLDVGCGDGAFIRSLSSAGVNFEYFATDISYKMISIAKNKLNGRGIRFFVCDAFNIPIKQDFKFEIIHLDSVLHHLIAKTKRSSTLLVRNVIDQLAQRLSEDGIMIIQEVNFSSFLIPQLTSNIVFYGLRINNNFFKIDLSRIIPDLKPGLEVNFLDEDQIIRILSDHGSVDKIHQDTYEIPRSYRLFLLKHYGHSTYLMKK